MSKIIREHWVYVRFNHIMLIIYNYIEYNSICYEELMTKEKKKNEEKKEEERKQRKKLKKNNNTFTV